MRVQPLRTFWRSIKCRLGHHKWDRFSYDYVGMKLHRRACIHCKREEELNIYSRIIGLDDFWMNVNNMPIGRIYKPSESQSVKSILETYE